MDVEKFINKIELEGYAKEILAEIVQFIDRKIEEDMPGVDVAIRVEFGIRDGQTPRRKKEENE